MISEPLEAAKKLLIGAAIGSCTCNTKSPDLMWHAPDCRYAKIMMALENVEIASRSTAPATTGEGAVVGPNIQVADFEDNSGEDASWHWIQDALDEWATETHGENEDACRIMSWSDRADLIFPEWRDTDDLTLNEVLEAAWRIHNAGYRLATTSTVRGSDEQ